MKKYIISFVCAMSAMMLSAVQMPAQYYRPAYSEVIYTTTLTQKGEYRPNGQVDGQQFDSRSRFVTNRLGQISDGVSAAYMPSAYGMSDEMSLAVASADSLLDAVGAFDCEENGTYAPGAASPIRRAVGNGGSGTPDEIWEYNGQTFGRDTDGTFYIYYAGLGWMKMAGANPGDIGYSYSPIGSPVLPFLLFALLACGVIYYRRSKLARA